MKKDLFTFHEATLLDIDWPMFKRYLEETSFNNITINKILVKAHSFNKIINIFQKTEIMIEVLTHHHCNFINEFKTYIDSTCNYNYFTNHLRKSAILDANEINQICLILELVIQFQSLDENLNSLLQNYHYNQVSKFSKEVIRPIRQLIDQSGNVDYENHPKLKPLYQKLLGKKSSARRHLESFKNSNNQITISYYDFDEETHKYYCAIPSEKFNYNIGHIIGKSAKGNEVFVELFSMVNVNNEINSAVETLFYEQNKILMDLNHGLHDRLKEIKNIIKDFYQLDAFYLRAKFAIFFNLTKPQMLKDQSSFKIESAFHPLIKDAVKNDLYVDKESYNGLLISGPNTGGKSILLKSFTLNLFLANLGLYVPSTFAQIPLIDSIYYISSDQQDLDQGLSSFSGEVTSIKEIIETHKNKGFFIFDELFSSTSSEEASALALGLIEVFSAKFPDSFFMISSHHQLLKTSIHLRKDFISGHMSFNMEKNTPNYKFIQGTPGSSLALNNFSRINNKSPISEEIVKLARGHLSNQSNNYELLLEKLQIKENELSKIISKNQETNKLLKNQKQSFDSVYKLKLDEKVKKLDRELVELKNKANNLFSELKKDPSNFSYKKISNQFFDLNKDLEKIGFTKNVKKRKEDYDYKAVHIAIDKLKINSRYFSEDLKQNILLKEIRNKTAYCLLGKIKITCNAEKLYQEDSRNMESPKKNNFRQSDRQMNLHLTTSLPSKLEYDFRGYRLSEFEHELHMIIESLRLDVIPFATIIHGHGTGVLKKYLRDLAKKEPDLFINSDDSGNDGQTRISIKE